MEELKEKIKQRLLSQKLYQAIAMSKLSQPDEEEIKEYYKLHKEDFNKIPFFDVIVYSSTDKTLLEKKIQKIRLGNSILFIRHFFAEKTSSRIFSFVFNSGQQP